jgi:bifunctional non-homologous end joining protein LigD
MTRRQKAPATSTRRKRPRRAALRSADGAIRTALTSYSSFIEPCQPSERDRPPSADPWVQEIKADGYRAQVLWA